MYRPPDDYSFYNEFHNCLKRITKGRKNVVILADLIGPIRDDENSIILDDVVKAEAMNDYFRGLH